MKLAIHNEQVPLLLHVWQLLTRQTQVDPFCTCPLGQIQVWFVSTKGAKQLQVVVVVELVVFVVITKLFWQVPQILLEEQLEQYSTLQGIQVLLELKVVPF